MGDGGYFKGEKKKSKKDKEAKSFSTREPLVMPEIIEKKKKDY
jgi:hypothetical protein